jgi:N-acetyl-alpha-D-glucosaminyl L-malate synthase BshA
LKIGIVCYPGVGGSGIVATELGRSLCSHKHEIHFISHDMPYRLTALQGWCRFHQIRVPTYDLFRFPPYTLALSTELCRLVSEEGLDIIHVHYAVPHSTSALLARMILESRGVPSPRIITTLHGTDSGLVGREPTFRTTVEFSINASNVVTAVSHYLKRQTLELFDIRQEIEVIHNPINTRIFVPRKESGGQDWRPFLNNLRIPVSAGEQVILHISNMRPVKRLPDTIRAFAEISKQIPSRLVCVGEGPDEGAGRALAHDLGVGERVHFIGMIGPVEAVIREGDLLISTCPEEAFGMSIAEAMACQLPVVAYRAGGIPEVVEDGLTGILVEPLNVDAIVEAVVDILSSPEKRREMGKQARRRIQETFNSAKIARRYETLYERLVS